MKAYGFLLSVAIGAAVLVPGVQAGDWVDFNGNRMAQKYATESQITPQNVKDLSVAWSLNTGDIYRGPDGRPSDSPFKVPGRGAVAGRTSWQSTPLFANNTVYVSTPFYRIFAVEPDTGKVKWIYDAFPKHPSKFHGKNRGMSYWAAANPAPGQPCQKMVYIGTVDGLLHGVDADTGKRCEGFGDHGILNINQWNTINPKFPFELNQSVAVYKDTLIAGWAGVDWTWENSPPGSVFGIDARTGARKWDFQIIPETMRNRRARARHENGRGAVEAPGGGSCGLYARRLHLQGT